MTANMSIFTIVLLGLFLIACSSPQYKSFDTECCISEQKIVLEKAGLNEAIKEENRQFKIGIIRDDLNEDGQVDFLAQIYSPLHCGTSGCRFYVFIKKKKGIYVQVDAPTNVYQKIKIGSDKNNGLRDLIFVEKNGEECLWEWNKTKYELKTCMEEN